MDLSDEMICKAWWDLNQRHGTVTLAGLAAECKTDMWTMRRWLKRLRYWELLPDVQENERRMRQ